LSGNFVRHLVSGCRFFKKPVLSSGRANMKKVLYLADTMGNGGAERQLALLVKYLPPEWNRLVWSLGDGPFAGLIRESGVPVEVHVRRWQYDLAPILDLWHTLIRRRPAIVHSWGWLSSAAAAPLCRLLRIPWVDGSIRVGWVPREHIFRARCALALADRVIANSEAGLRAWGIPASKGRVVYNGLDPERRSSATRSRPMGSSFTVVMAARMLPVKDFATFLEAARLVAAQTPGQPWRFLALGAGPSRPALIASASDLIEKGIVSFVDAGLDVFPYLQKADAGVLMTNPDHLAEGCSNTILEYMSWGLPVVCSDSGGNREVVSEGKTGFIVPTLNARALADRLIWLQQHPQAAAEMGQAGAQRLQKEFTVHNLVQKTVSVYEELVR
jgi:glycosyltransferase involved in cell wall biosynthesis